MNWHRAATAVLVSSGSLITGAAATLAQAHAPGSGTIRVTGPVRVIEADTLEVSVDGRRVGVGIVGIIAPPGNTDCGKQAIQFAYSLLDSGLELEEDQAVPAFDEAKRRMYRVRRLPSRESVAVAIAAAGFANADPKAQNAIDQAEVVAAAANARANRRGCIH